MSKKGVILIVDDSLTNRRLLQKIFAEEYDTIEAANGEEALVVLRASADEILVILLDIVMPKLDGYGVLKAVSANEKMSRIPVIAITSLQDEETRILDSGAWDYICKPFTPSVVKSRVENAVAKRSLSEMTAENARLEARAQVLSYIDDIPLPFIVFKAENDDLTVEYCNESYISAAAVKQAIIGKSVSECGGLPLIIKEKVLEIANRTNGCTEDTINHTAKEKRYTISFLSPRVNYCVCIIKDITELSRLQQKYTETLMRENEILTQKNIAHERYHTIISQLGAVVYEWDEETASVYLSHNAERFDFPADTAKLFHGDYDSTDFVHKDDREKLRSEFFHMLKSKNEHSVVVRLRKKNGVYIWCRLYATSFFSDNGDYLRTIGCVLDINSEMVYLEQLQHAAEFDELTQIHNKNTFYKRTAAMLLKNSNICFALLRFDIDRFKVVNELFGFEEGNNLLRFIAVRMQEILVGISPFELARLEADIFVVCLPEKSVARVLPFLENITDGYKIAVDIVPSVGIYNIEDLNISVDIMVDRAKLASETVKGDILARHAYFDIKLFTSVHHEQEIVNMMNTALEQKQFRVYLQPKYKLDNRRICGAEALARWLHPERGMIMPGDFIPIFERNGFIMKLDEYVWEQVCIILRDELDSGKNVFPISVNISKKDIYNPKLCDIIIGLVEKYDIPPELLQLELTESAYTDNAVLLTDIMKRLHDYGFTMMMDDFGSGYSSLNMLKEIPVDVLKIDLRFLADKNGETSGKGGSIIASVMRMAKWLNLHVITEGIETQEQADFLRSIGCPDGQGYYFAKPIKIEEYEQLLLRTEPPAEEKTFSDLDEIDIDEIWNPKAKLNMLFDKMFSAIGIYEVYNGKIEALRVNDSYFDMTGITRDEFHLNALNVRDTVVEEDRAKVDRMFCDAYESKKTTETTYRKIMQDGRVLHIRARAKLIAGDAVRRVFLLVMDDTTEEVVKMELCKDAFRMLEEANIRLTAEIEELKQNRI